MMEDWITVLLVFLGTFIGCLLGLRHTLDHAKKKFDEELYRPPPYREIPKMRK
ncbi:MAG: hypothetical protein V2A79_10090 [Planctomycetota bacterium]